MNKRLIGITLALWVVALTGPMGSSQNQDLTDKQAVQDAVVDFGAPDPQPASRGTASSLQKKSLSSKAERSRLS